MNNGPEKPNHPAEHPADDGAAPPPLGQRLHAGGRSGSWLSPQEKLTDQEIQTGLSWILRDGIASQAMVTLTSGAFLIAFALQLGASNLVIGLLAAIGPLAQLMQLPAIYVIELLRNRRRIVVVSACVSRLCWLFIGLIPFLFPVRPALGLLLGALVVNAAAGAVSGCGWNSWMHDMVPQKILGRFFSRRMQIAVAIGTVLSLAAAGYLDWWQTRLPGHALQGYSLLFVFGFVAGLIGIWFICRIPEPRMVAHLRAPALGELILRPFHDENFRKVMVFMASWSFAVNLASPFFLVYMLKRLGMSMTFVIGITVLSQAVHVVFLKIWGRFTDRFSNKSVLALCCPLFLLSILAFTFTTLPEKYFLTVPLLVGIYIVMGFSNAGVMLATGNIGLKLAPPGQATAYLATYTMVTSLASGIAPILGGIFADFFTLRQITWTIQYSSPSGVISLPALNLTQWDFFFAIAFLIGFYALHRLAMVREVGEVEEKVILQELATEIKLQIRTISTIVGLRQMIVFPVVFLHRLVRKKGNKPHGKKPPAQG
ncbi:MAG: MFS transporter [Sedimentisphaerales bacterium]|nr:MFS transporter [Sedimentisphaerales bacterium]